MAHYFGPDKDLPSEKFRFESAYRADQILAEDPDAFFHIWDVWGKPASVLFAVVRRPNNVHFKEWGTSFSMLDNGTFMCTGGGRSDYYTFNPDRDIRLADSVDFIHGSPQKPGDAIDALQNLTRYDKPQCDDLDLEPSDDGEWIKYDDLQEIIEKIKNGSLK